MGGERRRSDETAVNQSSSIFPMMWRQLQPINFPWVHSLRGEWNRLANSPCTRSSGSTTEVARSRPIAQVPTG